MRSGTLRRTVLAGTGLAALAACGSARTIGFDPARRSLDIANGAEPRSLDPHKATGTWENNIIGNMFIGLVTEGPDAQPVPGMATHWETSADGLTWTFYLREAYWSDGQACDAQDFMFAFQRILNPATHAEYASLLYPIRNAEAVNTGQDGLPPTAVGVVALDDRTLEIRLEHPAPYLLQLLKHYTTFPVPKHVVERVGNDWIRPENIVVNGPYKLRRWWSNYIIRLSKNPAFFDSRNVWLQELYFYPTTDTNSAVRSVLSGERGWSTSFPSSRAEELRRSHPDYVHLSPYLLLSYLSFNMQRAPFDQADVRRALAMAIDREFLAFRISGGGTQPAYSFVPPNIANYARGARYPWAAMPLAARRAEARRLLEGAGYGPQRPLRVTYSHRASGDGGRVAVVIQDSWRAIAPWVTVEIAGVEPQVHYANLRAKNFQVGDGGWVADFNDAKNYLYLLETRTGTQNYPGYSNPAYDALMRASDQEQDGARRAALMSEAEQTMLNDAPVATLTFGVARNLVDPRIGGFVDNLEDIHRARYFRPRDGAA